MLHVVNMGNHQLYTDALKSWYDLRHKIYVEENGWSDIRRDDELERDQFDRADTVHLINICEKTKKVVAGCRLNSSLLPTLTTDIFDHLCNFEAAPSGFDVADWTRLCVAKERRDGTGLCQEAREIYCGVIEYCLDEGISQLTFVAYVNWLNRFSSMGYRLKVLGAPKIHDNKPTVAGVITVDKETYSRVRRISDIHSSVLIRKGSQHSIHIPALNSMRG